MEYPGRYVAGLDRKGFAFLYASWPRRFRSKLAALQTKTQKSPTALRCSTISLGQEIGRIGESLDVGCPDFSDPRPPRGRGNPRDNS